MDRFSEKNLQLSLKRLRCLPFCLQNHRVGRPSQNQRAIQALITRNGTRLKTIQLMMKRTMMKNCLNISLKSELLVCGL
uniref:Uncharacterized protein n=1 Tax=Arundo donax TaxID=35708 RepID=A0A0A9H6R8_ARUDO